MFDGRDLLSLSFNEMRKVRGDEIAMAFQDPMTSLNPAFTIGTQLVDTIRLHRTMSKRAARDRAPSSCSSSWASPTPSAASKDYPHQLSGGMRQRALLALALSCEPRLLIADEPTTALDVTVQAQILDLLRSLQERLGMAVIFVTHDLGVVADLCSRVAGDVRRPGGGGGAGRRALRPAAAPLHRGPARRDPAVGRRRRAARVDPRRRARRHRRCRRAVASTRAARTPSPRARPRRSSCEPVGDGHRARCIRVDDLALEGAQ